MSASPDFKAIREVMGRYNYYGFKLDPNGGVDQATIEAPNLWGALKDKAPMPRERLMIAVNSSSLGDLLACDPTQIKCDIVMFSGRSGETDSFNPSLCSIPDEMIEWLKKIPATIISFNKSGFNAADLKKVEHTDALAVKVRIVDPLASRRDRSSAGTPTMN